MNVASLLTSSEMGLTDLPSRSESGRLNQWIFEKIMTHATGNILELGSGSGEMCEIFAEQGLPLSLSDPKEYSCQLLRDKFSDLPIVKEIYHINLLAESFEERYAGLLGYFDTVLSVNIAEHAQINPTAASNARKLLASGGYLMVWTPIYTALYNELDQAFNHWHRHNKESIRKILPRDVEIVKMRYFNLIGLVRRYLSGYRLYRPSMTPEKKSMFNELVPLFQIEDLVFQQKGLAALVVAQKK